MESMAQDEASPTRLPQQRVTARGGPCRRLLAPGVALTLATFAVYAPAAADPACQIVHAPICAIQGEGPSSPLVGRVVTTEGVVTDVFGRSSLDGLFLQHPNCDDDPRTSDGVFVYLGGLATPAQPGDRLQVTGTVAEYYGLTEIKVDRPTDLAVSGQAAIPNAAPVEYPADPVAIPAYLESLEGMRVALPAMRVVAASNESGTAFLVPASSGVERVFHGPDELWLMGLDMPQSRLLLAHGDLVRELVGPLNFAFERYRLVLAGDPAPEWLAVEVQPAGATPESLARETDHLRIATYNAHDLFDDMDDPAKSDPVLSPSAYQAALRRRAQTIAECLGLPPLVAVQEVENERVLADLAAQPALAPAEYVPLLIDGPDSRGIDVGLLYDRRRFRLRAPAESRQACSQMALSEPGVPCRLPDGAAGSALFGRPPLVVRLALRPSGSPIAVIVNHWKSLRGSDELVARIHLEMAQHVASLAAEQRRSDPASRIVVLGDLNDFPASHALTILARDGGLLDLHARVPGPLDYTYSYGGVSEVLDYILAEDWGDIATFQPVHCNVDFPAAAPARTRYRPEPLFLRDSDHDPVVLEIDPLAKATWFVWLPYALSATQLAATATRRRPEASPTARATPTSTGPRQPPTPTAARRTPAPSPTGRTPTAAAHTPTSTIGTPAGTATSAIRTPTAGPSPIGPVTGTPTAGPSPIGPVTGTPTAGPSPTAPAAGPPRWPLLIEELFYDGQEPGTESDEYIAFRNVASEELELTGWQIVSVRGDQRFRFPLGFQMAPGSVCRVYTNQVHPEHCGLSWQSAQPIWRNSGDKAELRDAAIRLIDWFCYGDMADDCR